MDQHPRPAHEPIINRSMQVGIGIQTVAITRTTLAAYLVGLAAHPEQPEFAETMAFVTLSFSELLRAYTARSERYPLISLGIFTNKLMNLAVLVSLVLLLAVVYIPFLQPAFNTVPLGWAQWELVLPLLIIPSLAAEFSKYVMKWMKK